MSPLSSCFLFYLWQILPTTEKVALPCGTYVCLTSPHRAWSLPFSQHCSSAERPDTQKVGIEYSSCENKLVDSMACSTRFVVWFPRHFCKPRRNASHTTNCMRTSDFAGSKARPWVPFLQLGYREHATRRGHRFCRPHWKCMAGAVKMTCFTVSQIDCCVVNFSHKSIILHKEC